MKAKVYAAGKLAYDNQLPAEKGYSMLSILIRENLNKGGTATLVLPAGHKAYNLFPALVTPVEIYKNGKLRWRGRALPHSDDFYGRRTITCEGELCFFNDAQMRPYSWTGSPEYLFRQIVSIYNAAVDPWKRFSVGVISVTSDVDINIESRFPEKAHEALQRLINACGGYFIFDSAVDGTRQINWYSNLPYTCNQPVRLEKNLLDYSTSASINNLATRIIPYGAIGADGTRLQINVEGKDYVENLEAQKERGIVEKSVIYEGVTDAAHLQVLAENDVMTSWFIPETLKISAFDLSRCDMSFDSFAVGQMAVAESARHSMSGQYAIVSLEEDLIRADVGSVVLTKDVRYYDAASANISTYVSNQNTVIQKKPEATLIQSMIVTLTATILGAKGGAVRLLDTDGDGLQDTLYIGDNADPAKALKVWRFNYEGWATSKTGYNGPFIMGATIENGLLAASVTAANLVAGYIQSKDGKTFFLDLDNGILKANFTELSITGKTVDDIAQEKADTAEDNAVGQAVDLANAAEMSAKSYANTAAANAVNAQTQESIFNKLTNNGQDQGIYMVDGKLYINLQYLKAGSFTSSASVFLEPGQEEFDTIKSHILGTSTISNVSLYDFDNSGSIGITDLTMCKQAMLGQISLASWSGAKKSTVTVTVDASNTAKPIKISGTNMWGRSVEYYIGFLGANIGSVPGSLAVGGKMIVGGAVTLESNSSNQALLSLGVAGTPKALSWKDNGDGTSTLIGT